MTAPKPRTPSEPSAFAGTGVSILGHSRPVRIREHDWRLTQYRLGAKTFVSYEWRTREWPGRGPEGRSRAPGRWQPDVKWPRYDADDGTWAGLPHALRTLWERCTWCHQPTPGRA